MKIWRIKQDTKYESLNIVNRDIWKKFRNFDARQYLNVWEKIYAKKHLPEENEEVGDVVGGICGAIALKDKALNFLKPILNDNVEFLPLEYEEDENLTIMNVLNLVDGLDYEKSEFNYFIYNPSKIMNCKKYAFKPDVVKGHHIFKIPETFSIRVDIFISDELKQKIENSGLKGFKFIEMWDSEKE